MRLTVNTKEFQEVLKKLENIIDNKSKLEIIKSIKLEAENNKITLTATDLKNYAIGTIDADVIVHGEAILPDVKEIIKSFKFMKDVITTIELENDNLIITNGKKNIKLETQDAEDYPKPFNIENVNNTYSYNETDLYNRIKKIDFAKSKDGTRQILTGIHFNSSDMVAIDGYRIALSNDDKLEVLHPFTVAPETVTFLTKTLDRKSNSPLTISTSDEHIKFEYDNITLISKLLEGNYFNYKQSFSSAGDRDFFEMDKDKFKHDIDFLSVYVNAKDAKKTPVRLVIENNKLELSVNNGKGIYTTEKEVNFKDSKIAFNIRYMADVLKVVDSDEIEISIEGNVQPLEIHDGDDKFLVLPVRINW